MDVFLANSFPEKKSTAGTGIICVRDRARWSEYVKKANQHDFYHTFDYHLLDTAGEPILLVYEENDGFLAIPLIKRKIEQTAYFDCTSVYGYTGMLTNLTMDRLVGNGLMQRFSHALKTFFLQERIVSCFCILHPLFEQKEWFENVAGGIVQTLGKTVAIDLQTSLEEQRLRYRRPIRMKVNQLRRKGFEVYQADSNAELKKFMAIYQENMLKVGAASKYLFDASYFERFIAAGDYRAALLLARYEGNIVAGAMIALTNDVVQLHLAGTCNAFLKESPMKLIFDEASLFGRAANAKFLHLGSGVGGKEDSLFHFKAGFSTTLFEFTTWQLVANEAVYNELIQDKIKKGLTPIPSYFPLYRSC